MQLANPPTAGIKTLHCPCSSDLAADARLARLGWNHAAATAHRVLSADSASASPPSRIHIARLYGCRAHTNAATVRARNLTQSNAGVGPSSETRRQRHGHADPQGHKVDSHEHEHEHEHATNGNNTWHVNHANTTTATPVHRTFTHMKPRSPRTAIHAYSTHPIAVNCFNLHLASARPQLYIHRRPDRTRA